jgi:hypothetical protein
MEKAHDREKKLISSWPKSIERKRERKREREIRALMIKSSPTKDPTLNTAELGNKPSVYDFYDLLGECFRSSIALSINSYLFLSFPPPQFFL